LEESKSISNEALSHKSNSSTSAKITIQKVPEPANLNKVVNFEASLPNAVQINTFDRNPDEDAILQDLGKSPEKNFMQPFGFGDQVVIALAGGKSFTQSFIPNQENEAQASSKI